MTTKTKMTIALSAMGAVCLAAVIGFVAVLAAATGSVKHGVNISYSASEFAGTTTMSYTNDLTSTWSAGVTKTFDGTETDDTVLTMDETTMTLTKTKQYVAFQYAIENTSTQKAFDVVLTYTDDATLSGDEQGEADKNEILLVKSSTTDIASSLTFNRDSLSTDWGTADTTTITVPVKSGDVNGKGWIYVLVAVDSLAEDFSLSGNFNLAFTVAS